MNLTKYILLLGMEFQVSKPAHSWGAGCHTGYRTTAWGARTTSLQQLASTQEDLIHQA
jgi:hypothetical protein